MSILTKDFSDEERVLAHRQKVIEDKLLKSYADEIIVNINTLVIGDCNGCRINHGSQLQHPCLTMEPAERVWNYFDTALEMFPQKELLRLLQTVQKR